MEPQLKHLEIPSSEITPEGLFLSRRDWLKVAGIVSAGALLAACSPKLRRITETGPTSRNLTPSPVPENAQVLTTDELGDSINTFDEITNYNNYYEFSTAKNAVSSLVKDFNTIPWTVEVGGLVENPKTWSIEELLELDQKERIYRLRCVEAWSMVIPWTGFQLSDLLMKALPLGSARYVEFTTLSDKKQMPGQGNPLYPWPYTEGLRLDEAMQRLTILATGLYGKPLPSQDGAPLRLVVPWKYGFKSIKAIVRIRLTEERPQTFWNIIAPDEYGFYSNVNPNVDHPRWSQKTERRIGELERRDTLMFNGYESEVSALYKGMDLSQDY